MKTIFATHLIAACAVFTVHTGSFAQQTMPKMAQKTAATQNAADPNAPVPPVGYRSVFKETSLGVETETTDWRKANDDVGKFTRGHVDILKFEEQKEMQDKATMPAKPAMQAPMAKELAKEPAKDAAKPTAPPAHKH